MTKEEIQKLAKETLINHGLYSVPVNPVVVASKLGVRPMHAVFSDPKYSGLTARRAEGATILIKENDSLVRKRFSVAHELGHLLLHLRSGTDEIITTEADLFRIGDSPSESWTPERRREYEANVFAAELLMPAELVRSYWEQVSPKERTIDTMANIFQVSDAAMAIRLQDLGLFEHE